MLPKETDKGVALYSKTNEPQSKSSKITSNDVADIISSGKTIGEMVETNPILNVLKDEIAGLEDYTIAPMTDKEKGNGVRGIHYRDTKLITLNMEAINDKYEAVEVLAHELQHAKQGQEYHKIVNEYGLNKEDIKNLDRIANAELYKKDSVPALVVAKHLRNKLRRKGLSSSELEKLVNYHKCEKVNTKMNDCYNVNPELIDKLLNETGKLSNKKEIKRYIIDNYGRKSYNTFADYVQAYNNYLDDINETDANVFGSKIRKKQERIENERLFSETMGFNEEIRTVGNVRTGYRDGFEKSQGNVEKFDERREGKTQFNTNRTISDAQRGIADDSSSDRNANDTDKEPTKEEINKATTVKNSDKILQVVAKKEVRKWYGGIQKDRYDVNKNLTSFVNRTKKIAKDLSKKLDLKVTDKMLREIMPFLRERTEFPESLNRNDLRKLFNSLSSQDKVNLRSEADKISDTFQKYYENYNYARGVVPDEEIKNHISHIWDLDNKRASLLTTYFSTKSRFGKERTIETLIKGIDGFEVNGEIVKFKPKTLDYAEILKISSDSLIKATHDIMLAENVKNLKKGKEKLVLPINKAPKDWVEINHPALNKCVYRGGNEDMTILEKLPVAVHPDIANTLLTVFERQKPDNKFWKTYDKTGALMKYGELSLSGFHGFALSESSIGNVGLFKTLQHLNPLEIIDGIRNGNYYVYQNEKSAKDALAHGLSLGTPLDIRRSLVEQVPVLGKVAELNNKVLWDHLHSTYKLIAYKTLCEQQGNNITDDIKNDIAQWVNDSFGGQAWELLGVKPSQVKFAHRLMLSPDWFVSTTRQFLGGLSSEKLFKIIDKPQFKKAQETFRILGLVGDTAEGSRVRGKVGRKFWITSSVIMMIGMYNILNACFREKDRREHPEYYKDMTPWDYSIWSNSDKTDDISLRMLPYIFIGRNKDGSARYLRLGKQFREIPELLSNPVDKISPKLNPTINTSSKVVFGRDVANSIKNLNGQNSFNDQDIWDGYGSRAVKKEGKDLMLGRANIVKKSFMPYIVQNAMNEKHNKSAWDFFAQTSNGLSFYKTKEKYIKAIENNYSKNDYDKITKRAYKDGMDKEDIKNAKISAEKELVQKYTNRYRPRFKEAIENKDSAQINNIRRDMTKHHIPKEEQRKIYEKALKTVLKGK